MGAMLVRLDSETKALLRWRLVLASLLVLMYHGGNVVAETIEGSTGGGEFQFSWEYDLETGLGEVLVIQNPSGSDSLLALRGVIPRQATNVEVNGADQFAVVQCCGTQECTTGSAVTTSIPSVIVLNKLANVITFEVENPQLYDARDQTLRAESFCGQNDGATCSAPTACSIGGSTIPNFVTIAPLECQTGNFDADSDVDLLDFGRFQEMFTGPVVSKE